MSDDAELWKQITQGSDEAFNAFYCGNAPRLQTFLRQIVGNRQVAEDIVQETFTQIWHRPQGFNPERGSLRGYLYGIARKRASDWWRRQKPSETVTDVELAARSMGATTESSSIIDDLFRRLSREHRTLLWLREVEGQSYAEIALILDIPVGTVRSRLFAAREALRALWHGKRLQEERQDKGRGAA